jgi:hypothetical protein
MDRGVIMKEKLWELRLNVINAYEELLSHKAIKSTEDKISGFTDSGIFMSPENMQSTIALIERAREVNSNISNFGRSQIKIRHDNEECKDKEQEGIIGRFGRSVCTTEPTALDIVENVEKQSKLKNRNNHELKFIEVMKELEKYMRENKIEHSFKCKNEKLSSDEIDGMVKKAEDLKVEEEGEKIKVLRSINKMKKQKLFDFCNKKPYQCLVCPYYYENLGEFHEMEKLRKTKNER